MGGLGKINQIIQIIIDYITISTTGDAIDFGDLTAKLKTVHQILAAVGVYIGGFGSISSVNNTIEFITIASTGNSQDFGDLTQSKKSTMLDY